MGLQAVRDYCGSFTVTIISAGVNTSAASAATAGLPPDTRLRMAREVLLAPLPAVEALLPGVSGSGDQAGVDDGTQSSSAILS